MVPPQPSQRVDVAVIGAGPAGLTAAVALATAGIETALVGAPPAHPDNRTTALLATTVAALTQLRVWERCSSEAAPLGVMRIVDATRRIWRAPEVRFTAAEIGLGAFGWNIENRHLVAALAGRADELPGLRRIEAQAVQVVPGDDHVDISLDGGGVVSAKLVVGADGRRSVCREAAGIAVTRHAYPQVALSYTLRHTRPHHNISTEFHTEQGPFTLVPLNGLRSSLVCVVAPAEADRLGALADPALNAELERRSHSLLGKIAVEPGRGSFPLASEIAQRFADRRIALVGEAAHTIPPIGAQGLNLGLRDAAAIAEIAAAAHREDGDAGTPAALERYDRARRLDIATRSRAVDWLNRSLLSDFLPVQATRGLGLYALGHIGPLRRAVMREGMHPSATLPRLMRGETL
jgi:2-octaprenyl-6-methoxyphenol hydroxylase